MNTRTEPDWSQKPLRTDTIEGRKIPIYVDEGGDFVARLDGDVVSGESLKAIQEKLRKRLRLSATRLSIPVSLCAGSGTDGWSSRREKEPNVEDATITGIHGGNNNVLIKRANGTTEQVSGGSDSDAGIVCKRLTPAQKKKFVELATRRHEAVRQMVEFMETVKIGYIKAFVEAEVQAAEIATRAKGA